MSLFVKDGKIKSSALLNSFMLSMVYVGVYIFAFIGSSGILGKVIPETTTNILFVWLPPVIISLLASIICALPLFFSSKHESVTGAFLLIALYAVFMTVILFLRMGTGIIQALFFYFLIPAAAGNLVCRVIIAVKKQIT